LKKNYFSLHKLPKLQLTNFWSQGILGVKKSLSRRKFVMRGKKTIANNVNMKLQNVNPNGDNALRKTHLLAKPQTIVVELVNVISPWPRVLISHPVISLCFLNHNTLSTTLGKYKYNFVF
jgi:hypothetical protein